MTPTPHPSCSRHANCGDITVSQTESGLRLDIFLAHSSQFHTIIGQKISRSKIAKGIKNGGISRLNSISYPEISIVSKPDTMISFGENFHVIRELFNVDETDPILQPELPIQVLFETKDFIAINKPAGIESQITPHRKSNTVANWLIAMYPNIGKVGENSSRPGIVHRLDRDTSGVLVIARNNRSFLALKRAFKERLVKKRYLAVVAGIPQAQEGLIETPLARSSRGDRQSIATSGRRIKGTIRSAETKYLVKETFQRSRVSLIELEPKTGRTHQIRVHLASIGHPVLGDRLYGKRELQNALEHPSRHLLHASTIEFPLFGKSYVFNAPLPMDFEQFTQRLRNNGLPGA